MTDNISFFDALARALSDTGAGVVSVIGRVDATVHGWLSGVGVAPATQNWLLTFLMATVVIIMMNRFRYVVHGAVVIVGSLTAMELMKPMLLAIGAKLIFFG